MEQTIVQALTCPNCSQYMTTYIYLCYSGHSICHKCRKMDFCTLCKTDISNCRNLALETICKEFHFPCQNHVFGCNEFLDTSSLEEHSQICDYRAYECKLSKSCMWTGRRYQLEKHCLNNHPNDIHVGNEFTTFWNKDQPDYSMTVMLAFHQLFYVHRKLKDGIMYWAVQYVGRSEDVILFCFQVEIYSDQFKDRILNLTDICHDDAKDDISEITDTGFCAAVPLTTLETYINTQGVIMYKIKIKKT